MHTYCLTAQCRGGSRWSPRLLPRALNFGRVRMRLVGWVAVALVLATSPGCDFNFKAGSFEEDKKAALVALDVFHQRLSDAQFEAIYESASDVLRAQPKEQLLASMKQTHEQWGKLTS